MCHHSWQVGATGHFVFRGRTSRFVDPSMMAPIGWPYRTTLMQRSGTWFLLEHCVSWADLKDTEAVLPGDQVAEVISFLHVRVEPVSEVGVQLSAGMSHPDGLPEPDFYHFRGESEQAPVQSSKIVWFLKTRLCKVSRMLLESRSQHRCRCSSRRKPENQPVTLSL